MQNKKRAVIQFLSAEKVPPIGIHRRIKAVYRDECVDIRIVRPWAARVCDAILGHASLNDKQGTGDREQQPTRLTEIAFMK
jgi:hypothetical protein